MTHNNNNRKHERVKNFIRSFIIENAVNSIIVVNNKADWSTPSEYIKARILPIMILPALMGLIFILAEKRKE